MSAVGRQRPIVALAARASSMFVRKIELYAVASRIHEEKLNLSGLRNPSCPVLHAVSVEGLLETNTPCAGKGRVIKGSRRGYGPQFTFGCFRQMQDSVATRIEPVTKAR